MHSVRCFICVFLALLTTQLSVAQHEYVSKVVEYKPAPGQFINTTGWGTTSRATSLIGGIDGGISLGGFGGYIVVAFDHPVANDVSNPYGVDFTVFGNPLADPVTKAVTWAEPGAVMVMKDANGNGLADDTWYELAGSDYYFKSSVKNYTMTYTNPQQPTAADVAWVDSQGQTGKVLANSFHLQPYYPLAVNFPGINIQAIAFEGTCIKASVDRSNPSLIVSYQRGFGYADNSLLGSAPYTVPDNPYTAATENSGGDAFDIGWAVDGDGSPVSLDVIHFIKIYNAVNADAGWLGEVSTEIRGVVDVAPNAALTGVLDQVVLADLPVTMGKNMELPLEAYAFHQGILQSTADIVFSVDKTSVAEITPSNTLRTKAAGHIVVTAALRSNPAIRGQATVNVVAPASISITLSSTALRIDTRQEIIAEVIGDDGRAIPNVQLDWQTSDATIADVVQDNGKLFVRGLAEGKIWLIATAPAIPSLTDKVQLTILPQGTTRQVYLTIKDELQTIYPRQKITVSNFDLNPFVSNRHKSYGIDALSTITVAHAIASVFDNVSFDSDVRFLDDDMGLQQLYLWQMPVRETDGVSYTYGYGGGSDPQTSAGWLVKVNYHTFITGLDDVKINEDDEIIVYHVGITQSPWQLITLTTSADSVDTNVAVTINASKTVHTLTADHLVTTENSESIQNETVYINNKLLTIDGQTIVTDELGNVSLQFAYGGSQRVTIAGSFVDIFIKGDVLVSTIEESISALRPWPNPAREVIHVPIRDQNSGYKIFDSQGCIRLEGFTEQDGSITIDALPAGIYLLRLNGGRSITQYKFIKS